MHWISIFFQKERSCVSQTTPALKTGHTTEFAALAEFANWQRKG
jgi:hypothetical protein